MNREASVEKLLKELSKQLIQEQGLSGKMGVKAVDISRHLNIHRSNASHYLNRLVKDCKAIKINGRPVYFLDIEEVEKELNKKLSVDELIVDNLEELTTPRKAQEKKQAAYTYSNEPPFESLIGYNYSLTKQIEQAKAAVMYPPNGLHTLIVGPTGAGKSLFAHKMYQFARQMGIIERESEFISFNCADYSNNPQLLFSQLFGYTKGAFSGADSDKPGLVEMADGSMLFLDEIHRLSPEGQETLFNLMDYGVFRRLGETKKKTRSSSAYSRSNHH